jgi:hypothetical protein
MKLLKCFNKMQSRKIFNSTKVGALIRFSMIEVQKASSLNGIQQGLNFNLFYFITLAFDPEPSGYSCPISGYG